ncbi:hypothetical protein SDC9_171277 [bioreactor metagenome]|uniref:Uncharacterized protein n=1 Tax=bioreactor metagenome TaxID=1076179 RepID=A0A645GJ09_9ZZZZ
MESARGAARPAQRNPGRTQGRKKGICAPARGGPRGLQRWHRTGHGGSGSRGGRGSNAEPAGARVVCRWRKRGIAPSSPAERRLVGRRRDSRTAGPRRGAEKDRRRTLRRRSARSIHRAEQNQRVPLYQLCLWRRNRRARPFPARGAPAGHLPDLPREDGH